MKGRQHTFISGLILFLLSLASPALLAQQNHGQHEQEVASGQEHSMQQGDGNGGGMMNRNGQNGGRGGMMNRNGQNGDGGGMMNRNGQHGDGGGMMDHGDEDGGMGGGMGGGMMMQRMQNMHSNMHAGDGNSGQSAFDLISQVVDQLAANPDTDWEKVNIEALRQHLVDMNQVTLYAEVESAEVDGGARYRVSGDGRTRDAIKRMVPTHAAQLQGEIGWRAETETMRQGVILTVTSEDPSETAKIRGLGFIGFMVQGEHHDDHHLMMAGGQPMTDGGMNHGGMNHGGMNQSDDGAMDHNGQGNGHSGH